MNFLQTTQPSTYKAIILFTTIITTSGCASILSDNKYPVTLTSEPSSSRFVIKNSVGRELHSGITPFTITLKSYDGFFTAAKYSISFYRDGYHPSTVDLNSTVDGWYFANIIFGGFIGMLIVDPATGAMWRLPELETIKLTPENSALFKSKQLNIMNLESLPNSAKDSLTPLL